MGNLAWRCKANHRCASVAHRHHLAEHESRRTNILASRRNSSTEAWRGQLLRAANKITHSLAQPQARRDWRHTATTPAPRRSTTVFRIRQPDSLFLCSQCMLAWHAQLHTWMTRRFRCTCKPPVLNESCGAQSPIHSSSVLLPEFRQGLKLLARVALIGLRNTRRQYKEKTRNSKPAHGRDPLLSGGDAAHENSSKECASTYKLAWGSFTRW